MTSVYNLCLLLIKGGKSCDYILDKMDVYFAAGRLTDDEYNALLDKLPAEVDA